MIYTLLRVSFFSLSMRLTILGSASAKPTIQRFNAAQVLDVNGRPFLIDCGEGTQIRLKMADVHPMRIQHIFISHLHGDHMFGLVPFLSTLSLHNLLAPIHIYAHPDLEKLARPWLDYFCRDLTFPIHFHPVNPRACQVIYQDKSLTVTSLPLKHTVPTCGFLFSSEDPYYHLIPHCVEDYRIPIAAMNVLKSGADYVCADGRVIPFREVTTPPRPPKRYAYVSDTAYKPSLIESLQGVDLLYHEATYNTALEDKARQRGHSSARQAALIARDAKVKRLVLGHFSSRISTADQQQSLLDEAREVFPDTSLAHDLAVFDF
ncbi:MAG: ribonuclease Z [Paludibacteraceae bacterium]|nr:ribonuclease Z [Paludibacteraceae bacterium]